MRWRLKAPGLFDQQRASIFNRRSKRKVSQTEEILNEDPFEGYDEAQMNDAVAALCDDAGFKYIDSEVFRKGAALAQNPDAYLGANFDEDEKRFLEWERGPEDGRRTHLFDRSRINQFKQPWALWFLVIFCSFGAAVQGWDESVINGAQLYYPEALGVDNSHHPRQYLVLQGLINGAPYLCCIISCWLPAVLSPLGRKGAIAVTCFISFVSCLGQALAQNWWSLLIWRLILGLGIGPKSAIIPVFASESVPESIRGALVMSWQMWTAFGIALGLVFSVAFQDFNHNWKYMLGSPMIVPFGLFFLVFAQYESPRWLIQRAQTAKSREDRVKKYNAAYAALVALRNTPVQAARDLFLIDALLKRELAWRKKSNPWKGLIQLPRSRRAFSASVILMFYQQFCGVNVLAYYSSSVFTNAISSDSHPSTTNTPLWLSFGFGVINFLFAIPAIWMIDYYGRRDLLLATFPFMAIFQFLVGMSFLAKRKTRRILVPLFAYLFAMFYSVGEGPVPFVYASESLPLYTRDQGMGVITSVNWGLNFVLAMSWPSMRGDEARPGMGYAGSFSFYAVICVLGFFSILFFVPETKQYLLEDLGRVFNNPTPRMIAHGRDEALWFLRQLGRVWKGHGWEERPALVKKKAERRELRPMPTQTNRTVHV